MPACLPACLPTCLPAYPPSCLPRYDKGAKAADPDEDEEAFEGAAAAAVHAAGVGGGEPRASALAVEWSRAEFAGSICSLTRCSHACLLC